MRIYVKLKFSDVILPADYSRNVISLMKYALSNQNLYEKYYGDVSSKPFCWAIRLGKPRFDKGLIYLNSGISTLIISTNSAETAIDFYKAFKSMTNYQMPYGNIVNIVEVAASNNAKIICNNIKIKMISPIIAREHLQKDRYLAYYDDSFEKVLNNNIHAMLDGNRIEYKCPDVKIKPIKAYKTVTRLFGSLVNANVGTYIISAEPDVLNAVYELGLGGRRGAGYGLFEVI